MNTVKLNSLWSKVIKKRFNSDCLICRQKGTDAHHLIKRNTYGLKYKWHPLNGVWLCREHHQQYENISPGKYLHRLDITVRNWYCTAIEDKRFVELDEDMVINVLKGWLK